MSKAKLKTSMRFILFPLSQGASEKKGGRDMALGDQRAFQTVTCSGPGPQVPGFMGSVVGGGKAEEGQDPSSLLSTLCLVCCSALGKTACWTLCEVPTTHLAGVLFLAHHPPPQNPELAQLF